MNPAHRCFLLLALSACLAGCDTQPSLSGETAGPESSPESSSGAETRRLFVASAELDEISGLQASRTRPDTWYLHNDDGPAKVFVMDASGRDLGAFLIEGAANRDWEDISALEHDGRSLLVLADTGDNFAQWDEISLYFTQEPQPDEQGHFSGSQLLYHQINLRYPDGARDCESVAIDPVGEQILFLTKRDKPPRLYRIDIDTALSADTAELELLGEAHRFRPPTANDLQKFGVRDGQWVSQPTGMDISPDGRWAAVISYRSLYLFEKAQDQDWADALAGEPIELEGPPSLKEEAVGFSRDGDFILVTTEGLPAPLYRWPMEQIVP